MSAPYEVLACANLRVWLAAANTAEPLVDTAPSASYTLLGANGADSIEDNGVVVKHEQNLKGFTPLGSTALVKVWRESEGVSVEFTLVDLTAEMYAKVMNGAAITTTASSSGVPGSKSVPIYQGHDVTLFALLFRGNVSPYGDSMNFQYWLPVVAQSDGPSPLYKKADPAGLKLQFMAIKDSTNGLGKYRPQTAVAS